MNKTGLAILTCLLISGCTDSPQDVELARTESRDANPTLTEHEFGARTEVAAAVADSTMGDSLADAASLLASTLEKAKAADKRVMVHLGAPW
jgi:hypothetical protein